MNQKIILIILKIMMMKIMKNILLIKNIVRNIKGILTQKRQEKIILMKKILKMKKIMKKKK